VSELEASLTRISSALANNTDTPGVLNGTAIGNVTVVSASQSAILSSGAAQQSSVEASVSRAGTTSTSGAKMSGGSAGGASATTGSSASSAGGAAMPTALYGMSLAGVVGLVGVLAL
jgi:hypothetical protein